MRALRPAAKVTSLSLFHHHKMGVTVISMPKGNFEKPRMQHVHGKCLARAQCRNTQERHGVLGEYRAARLLGRDQTDWARRG